MQKYDVPSAGVGALTVTSYCVWRGQDPVTALSITLAATVAALVSSSADSIAAAALTTNVLWLARLITCILQVINEYFFENKQ